MDEHGRVEGRAEAIHTIATGTSTLTAYTYDIDSARTHLYGDVTVVVGRQHYAGIFRGKHSEGDSRLIDVFVWRRGRWQAVSSQESPIAR